MAMNKVYTRINWKNYPSEDTAIDEENLNKMDSAINELDNRIIQQDTTKVDRADINKGVSDWTMDEQTGVITVARYDGSKVIFDLNIEKIPVGFSMSDDGIITMTTEDGTQFTADIGSMIPVLTFSDSDSISVNVTGSGKNKTYSFTIKNGSVTEDMLQPNYLADIKVESANAAASAQSANDKAVLSKSYAVGGTGTRQGEDTDNAKYYMEQAKGQTGGIPTKVSELENDSGYITNSVNDLQNYYNKTTVDNKINSIPQPDMSNYLTKTGNGSNLSVAFTQASTRANIVTGEKTSTIMGKIKKWFADMTAAAFSQIITSNTDLMATTVAGYLPDALAVKQQFDSVNSKLQIPAFLSETSGTGQSVNIDSAQYRYLLINVIDGTYATHAILSPNVISSLTVLGIQSQIGLQTANGYAYVNFVLSNGVFTWSSDSSKIVDIYGIK